MSRVIYIMGVTGCGKSTVGKGLAQATGIPFFDGDDFHPKVNVDKMASGQPLNDGDRAGWLESIHRFVVLRLNRGESSIIACSALKAKYRQSLSAGIEAQTTWVYLEGAFDLIKARMDARSNHFMPSALLQSQFDALEPPEDAIVLNIEASPVVLIQRLQTLIDVNE